MSSQNFKFKSAGFFKESSKFTFPDIEKLPPIGLKTPLTRIDNGNLYAVHTNPIDQIKDNFKNLILTNKGERLGRYDFGANLNSILFDITTFSSYEIIAKQMIIESTKKYIPAINISNIEIGVATKEETFSGLDQLAYISKKYITADNRNFSNYEKSHLAKISIIISYDLQNIGIKNQKIEVIIYAGG
jgi:phage baseplate assembly protein W